MIDVTPVNAEALARALEAVSGPEVAKLTLAAYKAIDQAMAFGYNKAQEEEAEKRKSMCEEFASRLVAAEGGDASADYEAGFKAGYQRAEMDYRAEANALADKDAQDNYDDGYVDGVQDARGSPEYADERVAALCYADELHDDFEVDDYDHQSDEDGFDGRCDGSDHAEGWDRNDYDFDHLEPKLNAAIEGQQWIPEADAYEGQLTQASFT